MNIIEAFKKKSKIDTDQTIKSKESLDIDESYESILNSKDLIANPVDYTIKCIVVGDSGVGKSSVLLRYLENNFVPTHETTIGVEFGIKIIDLDSKKIKLQIWDTAGQENFKSITKSYYRDSCIVILVYDVTSIQSFNSIQWWYNDIISVIENNHHTLLIGNKTDLNNLRQVSFDTGMDYSINNNMIFIETSAKDAINIEQAFNVIITKAIRGIDLKLADAKKETIILNDKNKKKKNCCSN